MIAVACVFMTAPQAHTLMLRLLVSQGPACLREHDSSSLCVYDCASGARTHAALARRQWEAQLSTTQHLGAQNSGVQS